MSKQVTYLYLLCCSVLFVASGCGSTAEAPAPDSALPLGMEPAGVEIQFTSPIDTTTTTLTPRNVRSRAPINAGPVAFTWSPVDVADRYEFISVDISDIESGGDVYSIYALLTTEQPAITVALDETGDGGKPLAIQFQVFAYDGDEMLAGSDLWAVEVRE